MKNDVKTWEITLKTPLHIGDGQELQWKFDFVASSNQLEIIDLDAAIQSLEDNPRALSEIGKQGFDLNKFFSDYKIPKPILYSVPFHHREPPKNIRRFLKNAYGQPYLAGSSLKGAVRTALAGPDYQKMKGENPHHDFLRPLQISDSEGVEPNGALLSEEIKFFNIANGNKAGWKDFTSRATKPTYKEATGVFVETLRSGLTLHVQAGISQLLRSTTIKKAWTIPTCSGLDNFESLAKTVNAHSRRIAEAEHQFFSQFGASVARTADFYRHLISEIDRLTSSNGSFIIRLSWGSGWRGMTGNWLAGEELETQRKKKGLGKNGCPKCHARSKLDKQTGKYSCQNKTCQHEFLNSEKWFHPVFPKTRRLAPNLEGIPCLPLGWVVVRLAEKQHVSRSFNIVSDLVTDKPIDEKIQTPKPTPEPKTTNPESVRKEKLDQFQSVLAKCKNIAGEIGSFLQKIRLQEDRELQKQMCLTLVQQAESKGKLFSKSLKQGKKWAEDLDALCREYGGL